MNDTYQRCNLYKKMAKDMEKELERTTSFQQRKILFYGKTAQENWMAALWTERKLGKLRIESDHNRYWLMLSLSCSLPQVHPTETQNVNAWIIRSPEGGGSVGGLGDPGPQAGLIQLSQQQSPEQPYPQQDIYLCFSLKYTFDLCLFSLTAVI